MDGDLILGAAGGRPQALGDIVRHGLSDYRAALHPAAPGGAAGDDEPNGSAHPGGARGGARAGRAAVVGVVGTMTEGRAPFGRIATARVAWRAPARRCGSAGSTAQRSDRIGSSADAGAPGLPHDASERHAGRGARGLRTTARAPAKSWICRSHRADRRSARDRAAPASRAQSRRRPDALSDAARGAARAAAKGGGCGRGDHFAVILVSATERRRGPTCASPPDRRRRMLRRMLG